MFYHFMRTFRHRQESLQILICTLVFSLIFPYFLTFYSQLLSILQVSRKLKESVSSCLLPQVSECSPAEQE